MNRKKFYSDEDIELAKEALSVLPDLTPQRKTQKDFLAAIRNDLIALIRTKGYKLADIKATLKTAGYDISEKALRDVIKESTGRKVVVKKRDKKADIENVSQQ